MEKKCPHCKRGYMLYKVHGYPIIEEIQRVEKYGISPKLYSHPPLMTTSGNTYLYICERCGYEMGDSDQLENYEFYFEIGGFPKGCQKIDWDGTFLNLYNPYEEEPSDILIIDDASWSEFWGNIDKINVWKWKKEYLDENILDGVQWEILIKRKGKSKRRIYGDNAYPEPNKIFKDFLTCVNKLIHPNIWDISINY